MHSQSRRGRRRAQARLCGVSAALAVAVASPALAALSGQQSAFSLTVQTPSGGLGAAAFAIEDGAFSADGSYSYTGSGILVYDLFNPGQVLAEIELLSLRSAPGAFSAGTAGAGGPMVNLDFAVIAGPQTSEFTITSGLLGAGGLFPAAGQATAGVTVTDVTGNGATLTGLHAGGGSFLAAYNGLGSAGTSFATLIPSLSTGPFGSNSTSADFPGGGGFAPIGMPVDDMSTQWHFTLTAGDVAAGTSHFQIIPAPGALACMVVGLLAGSRSRRRLA